MITFSEWIKKMAGASLPYDPKLTIKKSAGGWWGDPSSMTKPKSSVASMRKK